MVPFCVHVQAIVTASVSVSQTCFVFWWLVQGPLCLLYVAPKIYASEALNLEVG